VLATPPTPPPAPPSAIDDFFAASGGAPSPALATPPDASDFDFFGASAPVQPMAHGGDLIHQPKDEDLLDFT
jgi:hypothetical protein